VCGESKSIVELVSSMELDMNKKSGMFACKLYEFGFDILLLLLLLLLLIIIRLRRPERTNGVLK
jgi:hypothetical protein